MDLPKHRNGWQKAIRNIVRKHFGNNDRDVVILTYVNQQEEPCGAYDESVDSVRQHPGFDQ